MFWVSSCFDSCVKTGRYDAIAVVELVMVEAAEGRAPLILFF